MQVLRKACLTACTLGDRYTYQFVGRDVDPSNFSDTQGNQGISVHRLKH